MENTTELKRGMLLKHGEYRIERVLGQGGFGITYEAEQVSLGRKVAVKEFYMKEHCNRDGGSHVSVPSTGSRELVEKFRDKFVKEARMLAGFKHQSIVKVVDVFEENGTAYYVMEYLDGGSLQRLTEKMGRLGEEDALRYIREIAGALGYIHRRGTLHLDVKPGNIMLDGEGRAVLIDFGISKHVDVEGHLTSSTPLGVSKGYAPFEQVAQEASSTYSAATDIYSLGATFYFLLTGKRPPEPSVLMDGFPIGELESSGASSCTISAIKASMQVRKKDRPQSVEEFLKLLVEGASADGSSNDADKGNEETVIKGTVDKVAEERKKPVISVAVIISCMVAALLVLGLFLWRPWQPQAVVPDDSDTVLAVRTDSGTMAVITNIPEVQPQPSIPAPLVEDVENRTGSIKINSEPKGAQIWLDGKNTGRSTNDLLEGLEVGSHSLRLVLEGYEPYTASLEIKAGRQDRSYVLKEKPAPAKPAVQASSNRINGHEYVDLGLSVKWATCNVGASSPEGYGSYFAWGETSPKNDYSWSTLKYCNDNSGDSFSKYNQNQGGTRDNRTRLELSDDAARANWGGSWRMPTLDEIKELKEQCSWQWTTVNGHSGYRVTSKRNGRSIFLPAAGYRYGGSSNNVGSDGIYWSSSLFTSYSYNAYSLLFISSFVDWYINFRMYGRSVRAVSE